MRDRIRAFLLELVTSRCAPEDVEQILAGLDPDVTVDDPALEERLDAWMDMLQVVDAEPVVPAPDEPQPEPSLPDDPPVEEPIELVPVPVDVPDPSPVRRHLDAMMALLRSVPIEQLTRDDGRVVLPVGEGYRYQLGPAGVELHPIQPSGRPITLAGVNDPAFDLMKDVVRDRKLVEAYPTAPTTPSGAG